MHALPRQLAAAFLLLGCAFSLQAQEEQKIVAPENIPGVTRVDADGLLQLAEKRSGLLLIDSRIAMDRRQGYIEDSISLPDVDTNCPALARVASARETPLLFYCNGPKCGRSGNAAKIALKCGYRSIYWYRGGFEDWKHKGYPFLRE